MSQHITRYETKNGKTRKVKHPAGKQTEKTTAPGSISGSSTKETKPEVSADTSAKQGANDGQ